MFGVNSQSALAAPGASVMTSAESTANFFSIYLPPHAGFHADRHWQKN
jgi:hypothetical protein